MTTTPAGPPLDPPADRPAGPPAGAFAPPAPGTAVPPLGWAPGQPVPPAPSRRSPARVLRVTVPVVAAVGIGVLRVTGVWGGADDPQVGDCVHTSGGDSFSFDVVDCSATDAQYRIVGVDPKRVTSADFEKDDGLCGSVAATEVVLWSGQDPEKGTVYCAAGTGSAG
jgi:hypothetical protein